MRQPHRRLRACVASSNESERRAAVGEEADVGLHPDRIAEGADQEPPDAPRPPITRHVVLAHRPGRPRTRTVVELALRSASPYN